MSKKLFFGSNLKMYKNIKDTVSYLQELESLTKDISRDEIELFIIPSYTTLDSASKAIDQKNIRLGAQNMCWSSCIWRNGYRREQESSLRTGTWIQNSFMYRRDC